MQDIKGIESKFGNTHSITERRLHILVSIFISDNIVHRRMDLSYCNLININESIIFQNLHMYFLELSKLIVTLCIAVAYLRQLLVQQI